MIFRPGSFTLSQSGGGRRSFISSEAAFLLLLAVADEDDAEDDEADRGSYDHVEPTRRLELVQSGLRLLVPLLVEEAPEGEAVHVRPVHLRLKVGPSADDVTRQPIVVVVL